MNEKVRKLAYILLIAVVLCGCAKKQDNSEKKDLSKFTLPQYQKILLTDLENCDITFIKNMPFYDFDFSIVSTEKLEADKIDVAFDTTVKYTCDVIDEEKVKKENFGYALFCAYNGYEVKEQFKELEEISEEDYRNAVIRNDDFKELYVYRFSVTIDTKRVDKSGANEIKKMTVTYDNQDYDFDIGKICVDYTKKMKETFARDLDGEDSACQNVAGLDYLPLDNEKDGNFELRLDDVMETYDKEMELQSFDLANISDEASIENADIIITNEAGSTQFEYSKEEKTVIPKNSSVSIILQCKSDVLKNSIGYYISPIVEINYKIGKKSGTLNVPVLARAYLRTAYEVYANQVDNIDIFNLYLNNLNN